MIRPPAIARAAALGVALSLALLGPGRAPAATAEPAPPEMAQYAFRVGEWTLDAQAMNPDGSFKHGTGSSNAHWTLAGHMLLDDMHVVFDDGSSFRGSTLRTFDAVAGLWRITWVPAGGAGIGTGTGLVEGDRAIERFSGEDEHGVYEDVLVMRLEHPDLVDVVMDRTYADGEVLVPGVWRYRATRISSNDPNEATLASPERAES